MTSRRGARCGGRCPCCGRALGDRWLHVDRSTVALADHGDGVWLDLAALEAGASAAATRRRSPAAAALARGPFLAGFSLRDSPDFDDWRATRAVTVERRIVDVLERLVSAAEAGGDPAAARSRRPPGSWSSTRSTSLRAGG